mmetsp:Transcript_73284/g.118219  ORF Transcript_73284/g.118219 Transcript_73284/m.118219 type:complete len:87 (+) Transcript_73284:26-286(+)
MLLLLRKCLNGLAATRCLSNSHEQASIAAVLALRTAPMGRFRQGRHNRPEMLKERLQWMRHVPLGQLAETPLSARIDIFGMATKVN